VEQPTEQCLGAIGSLAGRGSASGMGMGAGDSLPRDLGVKVEATFSVEEYEIVILSAESSLGLEIWLKENKYKIPEGAEAVLRPYVQSGSKFFVAKVDAKKAKFKEGQLVLSPLRFSYDAEQFSLPVRMGLLNSSGTQDLVVHVIAKDRYELANAPNVLIPTNVDVRTRTQPQFGGFYAALLDRTFKKTPKAAVTEFAWEGALPPPTEYVGQGIYGVTCDPCPPPHPVDNPLAKYLGVKLLPKIKTDEGVAAFARAATVTRLHLRYTKDSPPDDLVFKVAPPIAGGVPEVKTAGPAKSNRFQGRYVMWISGCGSGTGFFTAGSPVTGGPQADSTKLIDPFEQLLVADLPELGVKAAPLSKDAPKIAYTPPAPPPAPPLPMPPPPQVRLGPPTVQGSLAPEVVARVFKQHLAQLRYCYQRSLATNPNVQGKVAVKFIIGGNGEVRASQVQSSTVNTPELEQCVTSALRAWTFPAPEGGGVVIGSLPIVFSNP
jgi:TonB family protein